MNYRRLEDKKLNIDQRQSTTPPKWKKMKRKKEKKGHMRQNSSKTCTSTTTLKYAFQFTEVRFYNFMRVYNMTFVQDMLQLRAIMQNYTC